MTHKILVVGSINMDLVVHSPHLPRPGETILGSDFNIFPGGKGANQAVAAARLGAAVSMIGRVGQDAFGDAMLETLAADGIEVSGIQRDSQAATGVALITVEDAAENTIVVASGANIRLTPADIEAHAGLFQGATLLVLQLEIPLATLRRSIELAHQHGLQVVLNPAPAQKLDPTLLQGVDFLIPNEGELLQLTGQADQAAALQSVRASGVGTVLVTLGEQGVLLSDKTGETRLPAYRVQAVDTTAAGDAFVGAFSVALAEGRQPGEAAAWACAAAAISVTRHGAQPSLPRREEVQAFLDQRKIA